MNCQLVRPAPLGSARPYVQIARLDHWFKLVLVLPGIVTALTLQHIPLSAQLVAKTLVGLLAIALIASSNYVLNEVMDAPYDRFHPEKRKRPVPLGLVSLKIAYAEWITLAFVGIDLAWGISVSFTATLVVFWLMGCIYNIPPFRSKDIPYLDVLSEAFNNPIRLLAGWFIVSPSTIAPWALLLSYWMAGCYFMALKRYSEYLHWRVDSQVALYRRSLSYFTANRLLVSVTFYASASTLFFGAFAMRYRPELLLSFPLIAWVMAAYLSLAFKANSAVEHPEKLYRESALLTPLIGCAVVMSICMLIDIPLLQKVFSSTPLASEWLRYVLSVPVNMAGGR